MFTVMEAVRTFFIKSIEITAEGTGNSVGLSHRVFKLLSRPLIFPLTTFVVLPSSLHDIVREPVGIP